MDNETQFGGLDDRFTESLVKDATPTPFSEIWDLGVYLASMAVILGIAAFFFFIF